MHVSGIDFTSFSTIFLLDFGTVPEVPYFLFFILYLICHLILVSLHAHIFMNALKVSITAFFLLTQHNKQHAWSNKEERGLLLSYAAS
jgi:hypothetical protein